MTRHLLIFTSACLLLITTLTSCHTTKQQLTAGNSKQPKFIGDIYMNPHNKTSVTANAIKPVKPERPHHNTRAQEPKETDERTAAVDDIDAGTDPKKLKRKYAELVGVKPKEIDNYPLYNFIDKWYGTAYHLGGSDESGIDCSGFAKKLYGSVYGIELLRTAMEQFQACRHVKKSDDAEEGDLVFFRQHGKRITHVGVYLANEYFVHASTSQGVVISSLKEEYWHKHYAGTGRKPKGSENKISKM